MRAGVLAIVALAASGGCSVPDLGAFSLIDGLRVIAVQAEPPEALPGQSVTLTALVVDTRGGTPALTWSLCTLPSNGLANNDCTGDHPRGLVGLGSGGSITITMPDVDPALLGPPDATAGVYVPLVLHAESNGDTVDAVYRLRLRVAASIDNSCTLEAPYGPHCAPNTNPTIVSIDPLAGDDMTIQAYEGQVWGLLPNYSVDSSEEYAIPNSPLPTVFEKVTTQWFATGGQFPDTPAGGTGVQMWTIEGKVPPSGGTIDLWVVGHDDRGGVGITHRTFVMK